MLSKTVHTLSRTTEFIHEGVDRFRGLTLGELGDLLRFARRRLTEERLPQVAGSLTFTTTLALVPLLTIALAIATTFPVFGDLRAMLNAYFVQTLMPRAIANTVTGNLAQFASKAKGLSALGAAALILTSAAMMSIIERVFNQIWRVRQARPFSQRLLMYWALLTLGPLLFALSITATSQLYTAASGWARELPFVTSLFYTVASVAVTTGAYSLLYLVVPNRRVDWRDAVWGGVVAAIAFELAKRGFAMFVRQFPTYAIIYGALAALPLFLLWIYLCWLITLVGAVLTAALPVVKHERWWYQPVPGGAFIDAMAVLKVLYGVARCSETSVVTTATIRAHTRIGYDEMRGLLDQMVAAGWVGRIAPDRTARSRWGRRAREGQDLWVLLVNPDKLKVADVLRVFLIGGGLGGAGALGGAENGRIHGGAHAGASAGRATIQNGVLVGAAADPAAIGPVDSPMALDGDMLARQVEAAFEQGLDLPLSAYFDAELERGNAVRAATS